MTGVANDFNSHQLVIDAADMDRALEVLTEIAPEESADEVPWTLFQLLPSREVAYAVICFYLGVNLMTQLDDDRSRVESLFELTQRLAPVMSPMLGTSFTAGGS